MGAKGKSMMTGSALLENIRSKWPEKISFDASVNERNEWQPIWEIVKTYEKLQEKIDPNKERWLDLANWCFNQAITSVARSNYLSGNLSVCRDQVTLIDFEKRIVRNLNEDGWELERSEYHAVKSLEEE